MDHRFVIESFHVTSSCSGSPKIHHVGSFYVYFWVYKETNMAIVLCAYRLCAAWWKVTQYAHHSITDTVFVNLFFQVSHHPPAAAIHVESKDWTLWSDITITSKFRGKYLQVFPQGITHIQFKKSGSHYTYRKVTSTVHNIIVGKLWVDTVSMMTFDLWPLCSSL